MLDFLKAAARHARPLETPSYAPQVLSFLLTTEARETEEELRQRLDTLLEGDGFDLFLFSENDPDLFVLAFPGISIQQPADFLFEVAAELSEALSDEVRRVDVEPEIDPPYSDLLSDGDRTQTEGVGDVIWATCRSDAASPNNAHWAPQLLRAPQASSRFNVIGRGVRVAQPDTGVADHAELEGGIDKALGHNYVENTTDPTDPLSSDMRSPGHGTGTSSVVASRLAGKMVGSAPGVTLVPFRAVNSVVVGAALGVAKSIDHAREIGCNVVTMSLGGPFGSSAFRRAVKRAVDADMIVLAAAGNCVGIVTYPASDSNVIAVAAIDHKGNRWRGSCRGRAVDISAPGENVYVARRRVDENDDRHEVDPRGQGTSYAVALTAGVAALWVEKFGHSDLKNIARAKGTHVQELFRAALKQTAHVPINWPATTMGAGIVDAEALLAFDPAQVVVGSGAISESPAMELFGQDFEGGLGAEANVIAMDWMLRRDGATAAQVESAVPLMPSARLARQLVNASSPSAPNVVATPEVAPVSTDLALRRLSVSQGGGHESAEAIPLGRAMESLQQADRDSILAAAQERFKQVAQSAPETADPDVQSEALRQMEMALSTVASGQTEAAHAEPSRAAFEALVRLQGRPVIAVPGDEDMPSREAMESWQDTLFPIRHDWLALARQVGRIDVFYKGAWVHAGTGFLYEDGRVMTNRHVIDAFAVPMPAEAGEQVFHLRFPVSINFAPDGIGDTQRFAIKSVLTAGARRIGRRVNLALLDMAVLEVAPQNEGGADLPRLGDHLRGWISAKEANTVMLIGYPAKPAESQGPDPEDDAALARQFWTRIDALFGQEYGRKYASPGLITARPGMVADDPKGWTFEHDATTLPGNSGSAVVSLESPRQFCGVHFGGQTLTRNLAHDAMSVFAEGDGVFRLPT